jgi:hypothetical protein
VRQIVGELGLRDFVGQGLRDLVIQYECCDWIDDLEQRVAKRRVIYEQMASFCHRNDVNKRKLLRWLRVGSSVALAAAILAKPTKDDDELILAIDAKALPKGFAQHAMLASILNLDKRGKIASSRRKSIIDWAEKMSDPDSTIKKGIAEFKSAGV